MLKQLALVVFGSGLFMAFLLSFIFAATGEFRGIPVMLLMTLFVTIGFALLLCVITLLFFGNKMRVRLTVNNKGALWETMDKRANAVNRLAIVAGILGRSPQTAGAGVLAASREKEFVDWHQFSDVEYNNRRLMITLRNSWRPLLLVCLPENYERVAAFVDCKVVPALPNSKPGLKPLGKALLRTLLATLAVTPLFTLSSYPFELDIFLVLTMYLFTLATVWLIPLFGWVVIGCAAILAVQITWIALFEVTYLYGLEQLALFLAYAGLSYLIWFSWGFLRGKIRPALFED